MARPTLALLCLHLFLPVASSQGESPGVRPFPRVPLGTPVLVDWSFDGGADGWTAAHDCQLTPGERHLSLRSSGADPYVHGPAMEGGLSGPLRLELRLRCQGAGSGQVFWATREAGPFAEDRSARFPLLHDGEWRTVTVPLRVKGILSRLRFDPGAGAGTVEVDWIRLREDRLHPLEIEGIASDNGRVTVRVHNHGSSSRAVTVAGEALDLAPGVTTPIEAPAPGPGPFAMGPLHVLSPGLPALSRTVMVIRPRVPTHPVVLASTDLRLEIARDGSGAHLRRRGRTVATLAPLLHRGGQVPVLEPVHVDPRRVLFTDGKDRVELELRQGAVEIHITGRSPFEGPVVRLTGAVEQAVFPGLEYLGRGESSSSTLDIETAEHLRFAPEPRKVTLPLMACRTEGGTAVLSWDDPSLQPVFAAPNFLDGPSGPRMALRGRRVTARLEVGEQELEAAMLQAVARHGLPPLPTPPRGRKAQEALCLAALNGPLRSDAGWGHCAEPRWGRQPYADVASTLFRLTGKVPELPRLVAGGAHLRNDAIYFLTGRAAEWLEIRRNEARALVRAQRADGATPYRGPYRRGHFEDTASGPCARTAAILLDFARLTGDDAARVAGIKTLEYMRRFRTPRGAQTWELSLHTPDIMAAAHLVRAYVLGFEITGRRDFLLRARRWAASGLPFVYLWGHRPVMPYATIPVFGATNWRAPNWIGLPVQWCGLVYADALARLAAHDRGFDWRRLAWGILLAGEQMQYPDGPLVGCLPDIFSLPDQSRSGPSINPCALVSLRRLLEGRAAGLCLATDAHHRVVSPFPVALQQDRAVIQAPEGVSYQVLLDGQRALSLVSRGRDEVPLR